HYFNWFNFINDPSFANTWLQERFYRISSYCQENYMRKITIAEMARIEFVNPNYFSQFFRNTIFGGFNNMLNFIRCLSAEQLLLTTELSVSEISASCGFSDPKYFYKHFKRWWGRTPQQHRSWYAAYMKQDVDFSRLSPGEAFTFLEKYIAARQAAKLIGGEV
ncbi:MAG: AraC family transcriptional regulator, partial [Bacillota bacterium]|nr:AraC family transcriptional regulator [Bacillota bacterium]